MLVRASTRACEPVGNDGADVGRNAFAGNRCCLARLSECPKLERSRCMAPSWYFREMSRGEVNVDPIQREFFTTEAIDGAVDALVRESIQNSLDAEQGTRKVHVRVVLSSAANGLPPRRAAKYFRDLWPHLAARKTGLPTVPTETEPVPFLVIEDFGTSGLRGDPDQEQDTEDSSGRNDFYYFWRNVGRSGKEEKDRGRWGLGKTVFPASSRISTFFGLTVRDDDRKQLLMGQSVLKVHNIGKSRRYPYGYFGKVNDSDEFVMPVSAPGEIDEFCESFSLARGNEPGLSIVIPFPQVEMSADVLVKAVARQYYFAILSGSLEVGVHEGEREIRLQPDTIRTVIAAQDDSLKKELLPMVDLASWACAEGGRSPVPFPSPAASAAPRWSDVKMPEALLAPLRAHFERGEKLAFRCPLNVEPENGEPRQSWFELFVKRDLSLESHRPNFIREGIIVSDASRQKIPALHALVVIRDKPLATLLGDAENPAHTEWQERSAHFRDRYRHGASVLRFVKNSVAELMKRLARSEGEVDPKALVDIFFLPKPRDPDKIPAPDVPERIPVAPPDDDEEPRTRPEHRFWITKVPGGFSVLSKNGSSPPDRITVTVAYGVRKGNAFRRYQLADFSVDKVPIRIVAENAIVDAPIGNRLEISSMSAGFRVSVTGFDEERDLEVRATAQGGTDDPQV